MRDEHEPDGAKMPDAGFLRRIIVSVRAILTRVRRVICALVGMTNKTRGQRLLLRTKCRLTDLRYLALVLPPSICSWTFRCHLEPVSTPDSRHWLIMVDEHDTLNSFTNGDRVKR